MKCWQIFLSVLACVSIGSAQEANSGKTQRDENQGKTQQVDPEQEINDQAFSRAMDTYYPLSPEQIHIIYKAYESKQIAVAKPNGVTGHQEVTSTRQISLAPGAEIPVVRLGKGYISTVLFLDKTGQPWPIVNYSLGNPDAYDIKWDSESNALFIQSLRALGQANLGVRLLGLPTPVMINLVSGQSQIDYRLDLTIPEVGPHALQIPPGFDASYVFDNSLGTYLAGVPASGAISLNLDPGMGQAWLDGEYIILKLKDTLVSPKWVAHTSSSDGTKVYQIQKTNTLVVSRRGTPKTITIKGF